MYVNWNDFQGERNPLADPNYQSTDDAARDIAAVIDTYSDSGDVVVLIGHSLGGNTVLNAAQRTNNEIDLLATIDPVGTATSGGFDIGTRHALRTLYRVPSNVQFFYNRWQTKGPFPLDFKNTGVIRSDASLSTELYFRTPDQTSDPATDLSFGTAHAWLPVVPGIQADLIKIVGGLVNGRPSLPFGTCLPGLRCLTQSGAITTEIAAPASHSPSSVQVTLESGLLTISGTDQPDVIVVEEDDSRLYVSGTATSFNKNDVARVVIEAGIGDDLVINSSSIPMTIYGSNGDDVLLGGNGDDTLHGGEGRDTIHGGAGNDTLIGGRHSDVLHGDSGDDEMYGDMQSAAESTLSYNDGGDDIMHGGDGDDTMYGGTRSDKLYGEDGNDIIFGGHYSDQLFGGLGDDQLHGQWGNDLMFGDLEDRYGQTVPEGISGKDTLYGGLGNDYMLGGADADTMFGEDGNDNVYGGFGDDQLDGGAGNDIIPGDDGNDTIHGRGGDDKLIGGAGNDTLDGGSGNDLLLGETGNDILLGRDGRDTLLGGSGHDILIGGRGADDLAGEAGDDLLVSDSVAIENDDTMLQLLRSDWVSFRNTDRLGALLDDDDLDELNGGDGHDSFFAALGDLTD